jgi:hypothetical protein
MRDALFPPILLVLGLLSIRRGVRMLREDVRRYAARRLAAIRRTDMREWYRQEP